MRNIFLAGVGGLGVLTMARILGEAGSREGFDVKTCEYHGLAQRYGAISTHIRMGKKVHSALIPEGQADLIIALEPLEGFRAAYYASKERGTVFILNEEKLYPTTCFIEKETYLPVNKMVEQLKGFSSKVYTVNASRIVKKETGKTLSENVYLLGMANGLGLLPVSRKNLVGAISDGLRKKFVPQNLRIFEMGEKAAKA